MCEITTIHQLLVILYYTLLLNFQQLLLRLRARTLRLIKWINSTKLIRQFPSTSEAHTKSSSSSSVICWPNCFIIVLSSYRVMKPSWSRSNNVKASLYSFCVACAISIGNNSGILKWIALSRTYQNRIFTKYFISNC